MQYFDDVYDSSQMLQEWHNVTVLTILQELKLREAGGVEKMPSPPAGFGGQLMVKEVVGEHQQEHEVVGGQMVVQEVVGVCRQVEEALGERIKEEVVDVEDREENPSLNTVSAETTFNPSLVVQSEVDESFDGNIITAKSQNLLVLPDDRNNTKVPAAGMEDIIKDVNKFESPNEMKRKKIKIPKIMQEVKIVDMKKAQTKSSTIQCSSCGKTFQWQSSLNRHMRKGHNSIMTKKHKKFWELIKARTVEKGLLECHEGGCSERFKLRETLMAHKRKKHGAHWLQCNMPGCGMKFVWLHSLRRHMKKHPS